MSFPSWAERAGLRALQRVEPEAAHGLALRALQLGLVPLPGPVTSARLKTRVAGLDLPNPVGLAAGFDKNAQALGPLLRAGFGFVEIGGVTPLPQPGNPRPRIFRLPQDRAVINRFGFNSGGAKAMAARLARRRGPGIVGLNLGANKESADRAADYATVLRLCGPYVDFATINVSSPNTEALRDLQGPAALSALLAGAIAARDALPRAIPLFLKIAPDLTRAEIETIAATVLAHRLDGIVATNTTVSRPDLNGPHAGETGGLSGPPLAPLARQALATLYSAVGGRIPIIAVGGIDSAEEAYARIRAGASAVQLYTALTYHGLSLAGRIAQGLDALLARDGAATVAEAVGQDAGSASRSKAG